MIEEDPDEHSRRLAAESLAVDDPTGWFERLYAAAQEGEAIVPWDRGAPNRMLMEWAWARELDGSGHRALVVGCGLGADAEYVAGLGFDTVAFDVADTAIQIARQRFPDSPVRYLTADLLNPPADWREAFDLVVEIYTVQALPDPPRRDAIVQVGQMVGPGGTLFVVAAAHNPDEEPDEIPPWPLTRAEIYAFATGGLQPVHIEHFRDADQPTVRRWRAEFRRP